MNERNQRNRRRERSYRDNDYFGSRQAEQFEDTGYADDLDYDTRSRAGGQMGDEGRLSGETYVYEGTPGPRRSRSSRDSGGYADTRDFGEPNRSYGPSRYDDRSSRGFRSFTGSDQGGRDFVQGGRRPMGSYGAGYGGGYYEDTPTAREYRAAQDPAYGYRGDYGDHDRGFFERAGDEIASWFGDEDAARRRQQDHSGRGPSNYTRSDERILEDACDNLTDDWQVDARNIQVTVKDGEVTLDGTIDDRAAKRRAEDCVDDISGVRHVQNNLRVQDRSADWSDRETETSEG